MRGRESAYGKSRFGLVYDRERRIVPLLTGVAQEEFAYLASLHGQMLAYDPNARQVYLDMNKGSMHVNTGESRDPQLYSQGSIPVITTRRVPKQRRDEFSRFLENALQTAAIDMADNIIEDLRRSLEDYRKGL